MKLKTLALAPIVIVLTAACGTADSDKEAAAGSAGVDQGTQQLLSDPELAGANVSASVDDAITDAVESDSSAEGRTALALAGSGPGKVTRYRACKVDGVKAVVDLSRAVDRSVSVSRPNRTGTSSFKDIATIQRVWTKTGGSVACDADAKHAAIQRAELGGYQLDATFKRERSRESSMTQTRSGKTIAMSSKALVEGSRKTKWSDASAKDGVLTLKATVESSAKRSLDVKKPNGEAKTFSAEVKTDSVAPLVIVSERAEQDGGLKSRTIVSGKKIATGENGGRVETVFENVRYVAGEGCYAASGAIKGSIFAKDAEKATSTFVVSFTGSSKTVTFTDAEGKTSTAEYVADGCSIDAENAEQSGEIEEKSTAKDVRL